MVPGVTTDSATDITLASATLQGSANAFGTETALHFDYGLTTSYGSTAAATPGSVNGTTPVAVSAPIAGLLPGQTYHYRLVATSDAGTVQGADLTFATVTNDTDGDGLRDAWNAPTIARKPEIATAAPNRSLLLPSRKT